MAPADPPSDRQRNGALDRWPARLLAFLVLTCCIVAVLWFYRNDLFPGEAVVDHSDDPAAECIATRYGEVDRMRADGVIDDGQAALFKSRGEAFCRAQAGQGGAQPPAE